MKNKVRCLTGLCVWGTVCGTHEEYLTLTHGLHLAYRRVGMGKASRKKAPNSKKVKRPSLSLHIDAFACSTTILNSPSPSRKSPSPPGRKARDYISQKAAGLPTTPIGPFPARPFPSPPPHREPNEGPPRPRLPEPRLPCGRPPSPPGLNMGQLTQLGLRGCRASSSPASFAASQRRPSPAFIFSGGGGGCQATTRIGGGRVDPAPTASLLLCPVAQGLTGNVVL